MQLLLHKTFKKGYRRLHKRLQEKVDEAVGIFIKNPLNLRLRNHPLKGQLEGKRAFSVTGDIRIIFEERDNYVIVILLDLGTHNQVYN